MKPLTKLIMLLAVLGITTGSINAQSNGIGLGFNISQVQNDYGVGLELISPYFVNQTMAVRISGSIKWLEHLDNSEITWTPYQSLQGGFRSRQIIIEDKLFTYAEGGIMILFPNEDFSSETINIGGYGLFGFEFRFAARVGYYLELGGMGSGARADKIISKPIYSNGFIATVGFRITI